MPKTEALLTEVRSTLKLAEETLGGQNINQYNVLDQQIRQLETTARAAYQETLREDYLSIVRKLEEGQPLSDSEYQAVELLVVGEAKYYLKHGKDAEVWHRELLDLMQELADVANSGLNDIDSKMHLYALCREVRHILPELNFYMREKERVERFKANMSRTLSPEDGQALAGIIKAMMQSNKM